MKNGIEATKRPLSIKGVFPSAIIMALSLALLFHLATIAIFGRVLIHEPNKIILITEIVGMCAILLYGVRLYLGTMKRRN